MEFSSLHIVWKEGKIFSYPYLLSRSLTTRQDERHLRTVEIPYSVKCFMTHNPESRPIQCHYAVSKEYINTVTTESTVESRHFPIYLKIKKNYFKVQLESNLYLPVSNHDKKQMNNF